MTTHRGGSHAGSEERSVWRKANAEVAFSADEARRLRVQRLAKELDEISTPRRSCNAASDNVSLETEGTGLSTLTGSSGSARHSQSRSRDRSMSPAPFTIYEDELQSRTTQSSYISRPIDVDSMQEYEEDDEELKSRRIETDDTRSRTTESTYSSRPIDVDSVLEYDPTEYSGASLPNDRFEKIMDFSSGYYEGESLLEYSSDDESVDFETGLRSKRTDLGAEIYTDEILGKWAQIPSQVSSQKVVSVNLIGPIFLDTNFLLADEESEAEDDTSFLDWEFPILDERDIERELVGYMEGFEPVIEDLTAPSALAEGAIGRYEYSQLQYKGDVRDLKERRL